LAQILVVDDTVETCNMLQRLFNRCGHSTQCLHAGGGVLDALRAVRFDLVLLDVMMPGMDGFAVLGAIRGDGDHGVSRVPVAMYSAISDPREMERALALGANEWIIKGTPFALLQRRLESFIGAGESGD
jgi:CheY-like chemotaxis protein